MFDILIAISMPVCIYVQKQRLRPEKGGFLIFEYFTAIVCVWTSGIFDHSAKILYSLGKAGKWRYWLKKAEIYSARPEIISNKRIYIRIDIFRDCLCRMF